MCHAPLSLPRDTSSTAGSGCPCYFAVLPRGSCVSLPCCVVLVAEPLDHRAAQVRHEAVGAGNGLESSDGVVLRPLLRSLWSRGGNFQTYFRMSKQPRNNKRGIKFIEKTKPRMAHSKSGQDGVMVSCAGAHAPPLVYQAFVCKTACYIYTASDSTLLLSCSTFSKLVDGSSIHKHRSSSPRIHTSSAFVTYYRVPLPPVPHARASFVFVQVVEFDPKSRRMSIIAERAESFSKLTPGCLSLVWLI